MTWQERLQEANRKRMNGLAATNPLEGMLIVTLAAMRVAEHYTNAADVASAFVGHAAPTAYCEGLSEEDFAGLNAELFAIADGESEVVP